MLFHDNHKNVCLFELHFVFIYRTCIVNEVLSIMIHNNCISIHSFHCIKTQINCITPNTDIVECHTRGCHTRWVWYRMLTFTADGMNKNHGQKHYCWVFDSSLFLIVIVVLITADVYLRFYVFRGIHYKFCSVSIYFDFFTNNCAVNQHFTQSILSLSSVTCF